MKLKRLICAFLCVGLCFTAASQTKKEIRKARPFYITFGSGHNNVFFQDLATSPLKYEGSGSYLTTGMLKKDEDIEAHFQFYHTIANLVPDGSDFGSSLANIFGINYTRLYKLDVMNDDAYNLKVGGQFNAIGEFRVNPILQNNSVGLDAFVNILATGKLTKDISNKTESKFLFIKMKPKTRELSFRTDIGLYNSQIRNKYVYTMHSGILGTSPFEDLEYSAFKGFRFMATLEYISYFPNGNGLSIAHIFDYAQTKETDQFKMMQSVLRIALMFSTKSPK